MVDNNRPTDVPVELIADATHDAMHQRLRMNCHVTCLDLRTWICNLDRQTLWTRRDRDSCNKHDQKCARAVVLRHANHPSNTPLDSEDAVSVRAPARRRTSGPRAARTSTKTETIQHIIKMRQFAVRSVGERASVSGRPPCMVQCTHSVRCVYGHGHLVTSRCALRTHAPFLKQTIRLHWQSLRPQHFEYSYLRVHLQACF